MSSVRMCDRCGRIFSENADDWSTFSGSRRVRNKETGQYTRVDVDQDACPRCTKSLYEPDVVPMVNGSIADVVPDDTSEK